MGDDYYDVFSQSPLPDLSAALACLAPLDDPILDPLFVGGEGTAARGTTARVDAAPTKDADDTELHVLCRSGDVNQVQALFSRISNELSDKMVLARNQLGRTPLDVCIRGKHLVLAECLFAYMKVRAEERNDFRGEVLSWCLWGLANATCEPFGPMQPGGDLFERLFEAIKQQVVGNTKQPKGPLHLLSASVVASLEGDPGLVEPLRKSFVVNKHERRSYQVGVVVFIAKARGCIGVAKQYAEFIRQEDKDKSLGVVDLMRTAIKRGHREVFHLMLNHTEADDGFDYNQLLDVTSRGATRETLLMHEIDNLKHPNAAAMREDLLARRQAPPSPVDAEAWCLAEGGQPPPPRNPADPLKALPWGRTSWKRGPDSRGVVDLSSEHKSKRHCMEGHRTPEREHIVSK
jgi:hypothetical protein